MNQYQIVSWRGPYATSTKYKDTEYEALTVYINLLRDLDVTSIKLYNPNGKVIRRYGSLS